MMKSPRRPLAGSTGAVVRLAGSTTSPSIPTASAAPSTTPRDQRGAEHLHACGPRALHEFLDWVGKTYGIKQEIAAELDAWRTLPAEAVRAVLSGYCGGREFPSPVRGVP
jgi:hypothetical protein